MTWLIVYPGPTPIVGVSLDDYLRAPGRHVQAIARWPMENGLRWSCDGVPVRDRDLWTGEDAFDPFGWGEKAGSWLSDADYLECWRLACGYHPA